MTAKDASKAQRIAAGQKGNFHLYVYQTGEVWQVRITSDEPQNADGLAIGSGASRDAALKDAFLNFMSCANHAQTERTDLHVRVINIPVEGRD